LESKNKATKHKVTYNILKQLKLRSTNFIPKYLDWPCQCNHLTQLSRQVKAQLTQTSKANVQSHALTKKSVQFNTKPNQLLNSANLLLLRALIS